MKLYTRSGDDGSTGLFGGGRVRKDNPRVEAYGSVDELNAALGLAACAVDHMPGGGARLREIIRHLQSRLFDVGADLATPLDSQHSEKIHRLDGAEVALVETWIDEIDGHNAEMHAFVLPGGTEAAARLHLARTVCRRAERRVLALAHGESINEQTIIFLNRVGDLLFAMARWANRLQEVEDIAWKPGLRGGDARDAP